MTTESKNCGIAKGVRTKCLGLNSKTRLCQIYKNSQKRYALIFRQSANEPVKPRGQEIRFISSTNLFETRKSFTPIFAFNPIGIQL